MGLPRYTPPHPPATTRTHHTQAAYARKYAPEDSRAEGYVRCSMRCSLYLVFLLQMFFCCCFVSFTILLPNTLTWFIQKELNHHQRRHWCGYGTLGLILFTCTFNWKLCSILEHATQISTILGKEAGGLFGTCIICTFAQA